MERKDFIEKQFKDFIASHNLQTALCFDMPVGFEKAFGLFDAIKNVLYINISNKLSFVRTIYTFYHELRHALQYNSPERFSKDIQMLLPYVVHFDGNCYMLKNNKWLHCIIDDEGFNFLEIYKSFPYEIDANNFAYKQTIMYVKDNSEQELDKIYKNSLPDNKVGINDILNICEIIKKKCNNSC